MRVNINTKNCAFVVFIYEYLFIINPVAITINMTGIQGIFIEIKLNSLKSQIKPIINKIIASVGNFFFMEEDNE